MLKIIRPKETSQIAVVTGKKEKKDIPVTDHGSP
jgi:hypothetical protein